MRLQTAAAAAAALGLAACNVSFPDEFMVEDLRILDVEIDPPEIPVFLARTASGADPLSFDLMSARPDFREVTVRAVVAHPDLDAGFRFEWKRCAPGFRGLPCRDDDRRLEMLPGAAGPTLRFSPVAALFSDAATSEGGIAQIGSALVEDPRDLLNGLYANVILTVTTTGAAVAVDTPILDATKRIVVFDPRLVALAILEARRRGTQDIPKVEGVDLPSLCTRATDGQIEKIFASLRSRKPNARPVYQDVEVELEGLSAGATATRALGKDEVLELLPGESIGLRGVTPEESEESYELIDANCDLAKFEERASFSWFTSKGRLSRQLTTRKQSNTYTAPPRSEVPSATRVRIWSVLRDGRGGSASRTIELRIVP